MPDESPVTLRELYTLVDSLRERIDNGFKAHDAEHKAHEARHGAERKDMSSLIRWAVTTVLTGAGIIAAIFVGIKY